MMEEPFLFDFLEVNSYGTTFKTRPTLTIALTDLLIICFDTTIWEDQITMEYTVSSLFYLKVDLSQNLKTQMLMIIYLLPILVLVYGNG